MLIWLEKISNLREIIILGILKRAVLLERSHKKQFIIIHDI
jgi:hypothetical protein